MDAAGSVRPVNADSGISSSAGQLNLQNNVNQYSAVSSGTPIQPGPGAQGETQYGNSNSTTTSSSQEPIVNSYRLDFPVPGINVRVPGTAPQSFGPNTGNPVEPSSNNETLATPRNIFEGGNALHYGQDRPSGFENNWQDYSLGELHRRSMAPIHTAPHLVPPNSFYVSRPPTHIYPHPAPLLQPVTAPPTMAPPSYQFINPAPVNMPVQVETQPMLSKEAESNLSQALPRPGRYMHFPQSGASPVVNQHRRHNRTQSLNSNTMSSVNQNASHAQIHNSRRRTRNTGEEELHSPRSRMSPPQLQPPPAALALSPTGEYHPALTRQQRADIARRFHLGGLLHSMQTNETRALQAYEGSLGGHGVYLRESEESESSSPSPAKGLDNQDDGRPEPKEAEELTVNLECKAEGSDLLVMRSL
ncbi:hypothetical protein MPDQ_007277 [Monascus purpureus]|uniref:Uncharacterized protein n=1 Tax=Monascus purpureus TaxID=5098 RepID=A0A507QWR6_MONPU|nr:hypothetical protein MPDQ_007277 [Monascus purpureus]